MKCRDTHRQINYGRSIMASKLHEAITRKSYKKWVMINVTITEETRDTRNEEEEKIKITVQVQ